MPGTIEGLTAKLLTKGECANGTLLPGDILKSYILPPVPWKLPNFEALLLNCCANCVDDINP